MSRIKAVDPEQATGQTKELLDAVQAKLGVTPNMTKTMAVSPAVLEGYLGLSGALGGGAISAPVAERIALGVAETNACGYCLSAHSYLAENVAKIDGPDIERARQFESADEKAAAALRFSEAVVDARGAIAESDLSEARNAGLNDGELAEIVAHVALNVFTNYFNRAFEVDVDFPAVEIHDHSVAA